MAFLSADTKEIEERGRQSKKRCLPSAIVTVASAGRGGKHKFMEPPLGSDGAEVKLEGLCICPINPKSVQREPKTG